MNEIEIEYEILQETSDVFMIIFNGELLKFNGWIEGTTFFNALFHAIEFAYEKKFIKESQE